mmetsp:Transcript_5072/g.12096  ORF Transcript_5072/g.12096 Transcript_5072/m.12096 type:complete len:327 (+) Transcript_5072:38-1018(+)
MPMQHRHQNNTSTSKTSSSIMSTTNHSFSQFVSFFVILSPMIITTVSSFHTPMNTMKMMPHLSTSSTSSSSRRPNLGLYAASTDTTPTTTSLKSDIFEDPIKRSSKDSDNLLDELVGFLPPPPEDQFIMTGDIAVLFLYSFIGHAVDDYVVNSVFDSSQSTGEALHTLDPMQEVVHLQTPVWVDYANTSPTVVDQVISMNAKDTLLNQWGPLFSSPGVCTIALCSTWLLAGYLHRAFSFQNSIDCDIPRTLQKTMETWITMMIMMLGLTLGSNALVSHTPVLQTILGCPHCFDYLLTKDDALFLVDTASILISWRFMANVICQYLR